MGNALFEKGREGFLDGSIDWDTDDIRVILVDLDDVAKLITGATNASPIVITSNSHGFANGDIVAISNVGGNTAANGVWTVANQAANTFELAGSTGNGAYTSGGYAMNLTTPDNLDDITAGARIAVSGALSGKTVTNGVADASDVTLTSVSGDRAEALIGYKHTGTESTSRLIWFIDTATGLPITPNGADVNVAWANTANKIFRL